MRVGVRCFEIGGDKRRARCCSAFTVVMGAIVTSFAYADDATGCSLVKWCWNAHNMIDKYAPGGDVVVYTDNIRAVRDLCPQAVLHPFDAELGSAISAYAGSSMVRRSRIKGGKCTYTLWKFQALKANYSSLLFLDADIDASMGTIDPRSKLLNNLPQYLKRFERSSCMLRATPDHSAIVNDGVMLLKPHESIYQQALEVLRSGLFNTTHGFELAGPPKQTIRNPSKDVMKAMGYWKDTWNFVCSAGSQGLFTHLYLVRSEAFCVPIDWWIRVRHYWGTEKPWPKGGPHDTPRVKCPAYFDFPHHAPARCKKFFQKGLMHLNRPAGGAAGARGRKATVAVPGRVGVRGLLWSWFVARLWVVRVAGVFFVGFVVLVVFVCVGPWDTVQRRDEALHCIIESSSETTPTTGQARMAMPIASVTIPLPVPPLASRTVTPTRSSTSPPLATLSRRLAFGRTSGANSNEPPRWETRVNKVLDAEQITMYVDAMLSMPANVVIQRQGCYALWKVSLDDTLGRKAALACGGPGAVVDAMNANPKDDEIGRHGCAALENVALDQKACSAVVNAGAAAAVVGMLRRHTSDLEMQRLGLGALQNMAFGDEAAKQAVMKIDGAKVAVETMAAHVRSAATSTSTATRAPPSIAALAAGEVDVAEDGDEHPMQAWSEKEIQRNGCGLLRNLALGQPSLRQHVCEVGGLAAIIEAMRTYPTFAEVQSTGCAALHHIASGDMQRPREISEDASARRSALLEAGGLGALLEAMERHEANVEVQRNGCAALCSIALGDTTCKKALVKAGAPIAITAAMAAHETDKELQQFGSWVVQLAAVTSKECIDISNTGGAAAVAGAMMNFVEDLTIQRRGCGALGSLASGGDTEEARKKICQMVVAAGGPSAIKLALEEHSGDATLQASGLAALSSLAYVSATSRSILVQLGICESIVAAMKAHPTSVQVQCDGCRALENISSGDSKYAHTTNPQKQAVVEAGGSTVLLAALEAHSGDSQVQLHANGALKNIASTVRQQSFTARRSDGQGGGDSRKLSPPPGGRRPSSATSRGKLPPK